MEGRRLATMMLAIFVLSIALQSMNAGALGGPSYIVPANPKAGDTVTIYYKDADADSVQFEVCSATGDTCYIISDTGKDNDTWWAKVDNIPAGGAKYTITAIERLPDGNISHFEYTGRFTVLEDSSDDGSIFPLITITGIISASALLLVSYWAWRRHNR